MKKAVIILGCLILAVTAALGGQVAYSLLNPASEGTPDQTGPWANINQQLERAEHWERLVGDPPVDQEVFWQVDGSTATIPITAELLRQFYEYRDTDLPGSPFIEHSTTHYAYERLIRAEPHGRNHDNYTSPGTPIRLVLATPPSEEEKALAEKYGATLEVKPVALDGFVFITHKDNPVDSLTVGQVQKIYAGDITNWKEVGGRDEAIRAYQREENSGSQTAMEQLVMKGQQLKPPIKAEMHMGMGHLVDAVAEYENGPASIGYTFYYYINNLYKSPDIKVLKIDDASPDNAALLSREYPFSAAYYAVIRGDEPADSDARRLRDYLLGETGQRIVAMAGYCPAGEAAS